MQICFFCNVKTIVKHNLKAELNIPESFNSWNVQSGSCNNLVGFVRLETICNHDTSCTGYTALLAQIAMFVTGRRITLPRGRLSVFGPARDKLLSCRWKCMCVHVETVALWAAVVSQIWEPCATHHSLHINTDDAVEIQNKKRGSVAHEDKNSLCSICPKQCSFAQIWCQRLCGLCLLFLCHCGFGKMVKTKAVNIFCESLFLSAHEMKRHRYTVNGFSHSQAFLLLFLTNY